MRKMLKLTSGCWASDCGLQGQGRSWLSEGQNYEELHEVSMWHVLTWKGVRKHPALVLPTERVDPHSSPWRLDYRQRMSLSTYVEVEVSLPLPSKTQSRTEDLSQKYTPWVCHRLNWTLPTLDKFLCESPNPQCNGIWWWGLWEIVTFGGDQYSGAFLVGWAPL